MTDIAMAEDEGYSLVREGRSLKDIQNRIAVTLPQWTEFEGIADGIAERDNLSLTGETYLSLGRSGP